jgi:aryl-alcohol dehydrogenase-like predicted oxidoreductase/enamine deaminase RidA (YjgF/YER057c/UK114 family)
MPAISSAPERIDLAPGLNISRIVTGLWQVADMERDGRQLDVDAAAAEMARYAEAGFDSFDMADHYGSAEDIAGGFNTLVSAGKVRSTANGAPSIFTKWCPSPGPMDASTVRGGIERSLTRLKSSTIDLLQFHWWSYEHPAYIDAMRELAALRELGLIRNLGLTNFDTDHLHLLVKQGMPIVSNQISYSLLDRRAGGDMAAFCLANNVKLLAYGTLAGGLLSEKWLGQSEPAAGGITDWSKSKYKRFIDQIGGWEVFQAILRAVASVAKKHDVSIANVATRWVLDQPAVAAVIVGARLGESEHRADNLRTFGFSLDDEDRAKIADALGAAKPIPGDCGDEYRKPPYLTASGDLSHHLESLPSFYRAVPVPGRPSRMRVDSGSVWEGICGYSRAVRTGDRILVSGTTATHGSGEIVCKGDPRGQTVYILDKIAASVRALGGSLEDVVRTRIYLRDINQWEPVARAHGRYFGTIRPANTLIEIADLVGEYDVEIEAEAVVDSAQ